MKLQQQSLAQTGVAIIRRKEGNIILLPLFTKNVTSEANELLKRLKDAEISQIYLTTTCTVKDLGKEIAQFEMENGFLPQDYMGELRSGFSGIYNSLSYNAIPTHLFYS